MPRRHIQLPNRGVLGSDPYTVLGVTRGSSIKEVKREYYKLAKKFHPDMNPDDERAKQMFISVQAAFRQIEADLDPEKRDRQHTQFNSYERSDDGSFTSRRGTKQQSGFDDEQRRKMEEEREREQKVKETMEQRQKYTETLASDYQESSWMRRYRY